MGQLPGVVRHVIKKSAEVLEAGGKPEPIMLLVLPIIFSRIAPIILYLFPCHHLLFPYYSLNFITSVTVIFNVHTSYDS